AGRSPWRPCEFAPRPLPAPAARGALPPPRPRARDRRADGCVHQAGERRRPVRRARRAAPRCLRDRGARAGRGRAPGRAGWRSARSPPVIAAIIFAIARAQRAAVLANQRQIRGPRGWLRERWDAYRVFAEFARSVTEAMEQWGPRPRPLELHVVGAELFEAAL